MENHGSINRRDFLLTTAATVGVDSALAAAAAPTTSFEAELPQGIHSKDPLAQFWQKPVSDLIEVKLAPELTSEVVKERHRIYSLLLMALIVRFWNGNNNGPLGIYPQRERQKAAEQDPNARYYRYLGDMNASDDPQRVSWDRYLGHNIACLAVDGKGEVIDFDFNHNNFFRSSAEHAESRLVRRLFSLTDLIDDWKTGHQIPGKSRAFSLKDVTIYTSLESCAQCSGVMSLGRVKQVVYLQNDPGAYRVGNIMYNLAGHEELPPGGDGSALAAIPMPASEIGLPYLDELNRKYEQFRENMAHAEKINDATLAYFRRPSDLNPTFTQSITSFLCTDTARGIFKDGESEFHAMTLKHADARYPDQDDVWKNQKCLDEAYKFFNYADVEGFRGSPHKL
jgi:tRNA(Arg) A34 adenosine deaminase TadA